MKRVWVIWAVSVLFIDSGMLSAQGDISSAYQYTDTFSTNKAENDSYVHSLFRSSEGTIPAGPTLIYRRLGNERSLYLSGVTAEPAHLGYYFPIPARFTEGAIRGTLRVNVSYNMASDHYLNISVSGDGMDWSEPEFLKEGLNVIDLASDYGGCYVILLGSRASIDNLAVDLFEQAVTWRVPTDVETIQEAINRAQDGDIIEVAPGEYSGTGNTNIDFLGKAITVQSASGPQDTIIRCDAAEGQVSRGFYFHSDEQADSVLRGFTITGGRVWGSEWPSPNTTWSESPSYPIGAGIFCEFASPTISECYIYDCGTELGGGIGCVGGEPTITSCRIEENRAGGFGPMGSGGYGAGMGLIRACRARVTHCIIQANCAYENSLGGGIYINDTSPADERDLNNNQGIVFQHCNIRLNGALDNVKGKGGGIYIAGNATNVRVQNCLLCKNTAEDGSAVYYTDPSTQSLRATSEDEDLALYLVNCTIANNTLSPGTGPRGAVSLASPFYIRNSILWDNDGDSLVLLSLDAETYNKVTYNNIQGGADGLGNIEGNPLFANVNGNDFHLQSRRGRFDANSGRWFIDSQHSPCIDAGDPRDPIGQEESPNGSRINMGAYGGTCEASKGGQVYHVSKQGRDGNSGLSREQAFLTISRAVSLANNGDSIFVWPGEYQEPIEFADKSIRIQSISRPAVISAPGGTAFKFIHQEGRGSMLSNFIITDSNTGIECYLASPTLSNLTIVGNRFGLSATEGSQPDVSNCIFWDNARSDIFCDPPYSVTPRYCCIEKSNEAAQAAGVGNINMDPLFAENSDYTLQSEYGRYSFESDTWVYDNDTSPCIDAGDPGNGAKGEPFYNGGIINMGAYGGTPYASKSIPDAEAVDISTYENSELYSKTWLDLLPWTSYKYDILMDALAQIYEKTISSDTDALNSNPCDRSALNSIAD